MPEIRSIALVSLGCPKNLVDSERMLGLLASDGLAVATEAEDADAIVINTCGFLEASKVEAMKEIHRAIRLKETGKCRRVVVAGCLVQRHKTRLLAEAPGIDRLVGVFDREHIVRAVRGNTNRGHDVHFLGKYHDLSRRLDKKNSKPAGYTEDDRGRLRLTPRHYAFLRISEGCNQGCTFCTIPSIRGLMRSKPIEHVLAEITPRVEYPAAIVIAEPRRRANLSERQQGFQHIFDRAVECRRDRDIVRSS